MPKQTTNYALKKPLGTESALIDVLNENFDVIDTALTPEIDDVYEPPVPTTNNPAKNRLNIVLGWIANRIKAVTGKNKWYEVPSIDLETVSKHINVGGDVHPEATTSLSGFMSSKDKYKLDKSTWAVTPSTLMSRDSSGRVRVADPNNSQDAANKGFVENTIKSHKEEETAHEEATQGKAGFLSAVDKIKLDGATKTATPSTLIKRDIDGRAQVSDPVADLDIANKKFVQKTMEGQFVFGTYTGDGAETREIILGFKPKAVMVNSVGAAPTSYNGGIAIQGQNATTAPSNSGDYAITYSAHFVTVAITDVGFKVSYCSSSAHAKTNTSSTLYIYIAIK